MVGFVTVVVTLGLIAGALNFSKLPLVNSNVIRYADFQDAAGLASGDEVTVHGVDVGTVTGLSLVRWPKGPYVQVRFTVDSGVHLGSTTSATAKVLSPIGTEYMALTPSGAGSLSGDIPTSRTTVPYTLVGALTQLGEQISQYNTSQLAQSFEVGTQDLSATNAQETTAAFAGLAKVSQILGNQSTALATIITQGDDLATTLSQRSTQLFDLVGQGDQVLQVLEQRKAAINELLAATSTLGQQLTGILAGNRGQLSSLLSSLQTVSAVLAKDSSDISAALPVMAAFSKYAANSTGSGPFADASIPTLLLPASFLAQCHNASAYPSSNPIVGCRP